MLRFRLHDGKLLRKKLSASPPLTLIPSKRLGGPPLSAVLKSLRKMLACAAVENICALPSVDHVALVGGEALSYFLSNSGPSRTPPPRIGIWEKSSNWVASARSYLGEEINKRATTMPRISPAPVGLFVRRALRTANSPAQYSSASPRTPGGWAEVEPVWR